MQMFYEDQTISRRMKHIDADVTKTSLGLTDFSDFPDSELLYHLL